MTSTFAGPAEEELAEAVDHYDRITAGLGNRFLSEVRNAVHLIETFPESSEEIDDRVRMKVLPEFPYSIFYIVDDEEILILAVAHQKRRPRYWRDRVAGR